MYDVPHQEEGNTPENNTPMTTDDNSNPIKKLDDQQPQNETTKSPTTPTPITTTPTPTTTTPPPITTTTTPYCNANSVDNASGTTAITTTTVAAIPTTNTLDTIHDNNNNNNNNISHSNSSISDNCSNNSSTETSITSATVDEIHLRQSNKSNTSVPSPKGYTPQEQEQGKNEKDEKTFWIQMALEYLCQRHEEEKAKPRKSQIINEKNYQILLECIQRKTNESENKVYSLSDLLEWCETLLSNKHDSSNPDSPSSPVSVSNASIFTNVTTPCSVSSTEKNRNMKMSLWMEIEKNVNIEKNVLSLSSSNMKKSTYLGNNDDEEEEEEEEDNDDEDDDEDNDDDEDDNDDNEDDEEEDNDDENNDDENNDDNDDGDNEDDEGELENKTIYKEKERINQKDDANSEQNSTFSAPQTSFIPKNKKPNYLSGMYLGFTSFEELRWITLNKFIELLTPHRVLLSMCSRDDINEGNENDKLTSQKASDKSNPQASSNSNAKNTDNNIEPIQNDEEKTIIHWICCFVLTFVRFTEPELLLLQCLERFQVPSSISLPSSSSSMISSSSPLSSSPKSSTTTTTTSTTTSSSTTSSSTTTTGPSSSSTSFVPPVSQQFSSFIEKEFCSQEIYHIQNNVCSFISFWLYYSFSTWSFPMLQIIVHFIHDHLLPSSLLAKKGQTLLDIIHYSYQKSSSQAIYTRNDILLYLKEENNAEKLDSEKLDSVTKENKTNRNHGKVSIHENGHKNDGNQNEDSNQNNWRGHIDQCELNRINFQISSPLPCISLECVQNFTSLLEINATELARQITLMDYELLSSVHPPELLYYQNTKQRIEKSPNICLIVDRFKKFSNWVMFSVLKEEKLMERKKKVEFFVKFAIQLRQMNNLQSSMAVISALQSTALFRLKHTLQVIEPEIISQIMKLSKLFSPTKSFRLLRNATKDAKQGPMIPYIGIALADIAFVMDGSAFYVERSASDMPLYSAKQIQLLGRVIYEFSQTKNKAFHFIPIPKLKNSIQSNIFDCNFDEKDAHRLSFLREPKNSKKEDLII